MILHVWLSYMTTTWPGAPDDYTSATPTPSRVEFTKPQLYAIDTDALLADLEETAPRGGKERG